MALSVLKIKIPPNRHTLHGLSISQSVPLELSRLVNQKKGESNFKVFYQLCAGLKPELVAKFGLKSTQNYFYLNGVCFYLN